MASLDTKPGLFAITNFIRTNCEKGINYSNTSAILMVPL